MKLLTISLLLFVSISVYGQGPCNNPNPPSWCGGITGPNPCQGNNPPTWCGSIEVPLDDYYWMLALIGLGIGICHRNKIELKKI
jgi:hypothetical protein